MWVWEESRIYISLVHGDLPRQHSFGTTLNFIGPVGGLSVVNAIGTQLRDQILRRERGQGNVDFLCSAGHVQDWEHV